jgi:hypothetical protein
VGSVKTRLWNTGTTSIFFEGDYKNARREIKALPSRKMKIYHNVRNSIKLIPQPPAAHLSMKQTGTYRCT